MATARRLTRKAKAGSLLPVAFSGTPKVASVVFATPFPSAAYAIVVDVETSGGKTYAYAIESRTASGFIIAFCANTLSSLVRISWQASLEGED